MLSTGEASGNLSSISADHHTLERVDSSASASSSGHGSITLLRETSDSFGMSLPTRTRSGFGEEATDGSQLKRINRDDDDAQSLALGSGLMSSSFAQNRFLMSETVDEGDEFEQGTPSGSFRKAPVPRDGTSTEVSGSAIARYARRPGTAPLPPLKRPQSGTPQVERPSTAVASMMEAAFEQDAEPELTQEVLERSVAANSSTFLFPSRLLMPHPARFPSDILCPRAWFPVFMLGEKGTE